MRWRSPDERNQKKVLHKCNTFGCGITHCAKTSQESLCSISKKIELNSVAVYREIHVQQGFASASGSFHTKLKPIIAIACIRTASANVCQILMEERLVRGSIAKTG